mmetsp:Transcript_16185/g.44816  ORF Transcript_16185/g.44816 Transcript_16185/m.44816 type:complete len:218 (+) Transcript_16185:1273-1926(+)
MAPSPVSIAKYGGRPVNSENTGTQRRQAIPLQNTKSPRGASSDGSGRVEFSNESSSSTWFTRNARETTRQTKDGMNNSVTVGIVESWLLIQSMVVVTSPIGVQTPPAFAATTTIPPKSFLSSTFGTSFFNSEHMTIVTVKLLRIAERKNVRKPIVQKRDFLEVVLIWFVTTLKPWWASTTSTIVEAASRKKQISETSASCSPNCSITESDATPVLSK